MPTRTENLGRLGWAHQCPVESRYRSSRREARFGHSMRIVRASLRRLLQVEDVLPGGNFRMRLIETGRIADCAIEDDWDEGLNALNSLQPR